MAGEGHVMTTHAQKYMNSHDRKKRPPSECHINILEKGKERWNGGRRRRRKDGAGTDGEMDRGIEGTKSFVFTELIWRLSCGSGGPRSRADHNTGTPR